jgi:hypothetical protein
MGEIRRAIAREEESAGYRIASSPTVVIAASIIAAVGLARDADISQSSPWLYSVVSDSVALT